MTWQTDMVNILRVVINDINDLGFSPSFSDTRLENILAVAAWQVQQELDLDNTYVININAPSINPDPTLAASLDDIFINFVILKAACIADKALYRDRALSSGLKAIAGPSLLGTLTYSEGLSDLLINDNSACMMYESLKKDYEFGNIEKVRAVLSPFIGDYTGETEEEVTVADDFGTTIEIENGFQRILEFDASVLDGDFVSRWDAYTSWFQQRFELYSYSTKSNQSFTYGNGVHTDLFKPTYNHSKRAYEFDTTVGLVGNPNFTNVVDTPNAPGGPAGPLYGSGNNGWDASGSKVIRLDTRFRVGFDLEISSNFWEQFQDVVANTTARWLTLWQFKNTYSYFLDLVLALGWDWGDTSNPSYRLFQRGDSSLTERDISEWDNNTLLTGIPMNLGQREKWVIEAEFDPDGVNSYTKVQRDNEVLLENTLINCFPITDVQGWMSSYTNRIPMIRGMYFGGYAGTTPTYSFGEPVYVWFSNMSYDVETY